MLDAIALERRGVPAAIIGIEKLVGTTGKGMARAQGFANLRMATLTHSLGTMMGLHDPKMVEELATQALPQVTQILLK